MSLLLVGGALVGTALGATLRVSAAEYPTLAAAIAASAPGDRIEIAAGTFVGAAVWDHDLTITGAGEGLTVLDGGGGAYTLSATGLSSQSALSGLTITNAGGGGGLSLTMSSVQVAHVELVGLGSETGAGAVTIIGGAPSFRATTLRDNRALRGAGIYASGAIVTLDGAVLEGNSAAEYGGGIFLSSSELVLSGSVLEGNLAATYDGGAIYGEAAVVRSTDNQLLGNASGANGGAILLASGSTLDDARSVFSDNTAYASGGDVYAWYTVDLAFEGTFFSESTATYAYGGSISASYDVALTAVDCQWERPYAYYGGGAIYLYDTVRPATITGSSFLEGTALYSVGGAIYSYYLAPLTLRNVLFEGNEAPYSHGGAIYAVYYAPLDVADTTFRDNVAGAGSGGAIYHEDYGSAGSQLLRTLFEGNLASFQGGGAFIGSSLALQVVDSTFRDNAAGDDSFGGALHLAANYDVELVRNHFLLNHAGHGGAVYDAANAGGVGHDRWSNNVFQENSARTGGAACLVQNQSSSLSNNSFVGNAASEEAGALCVVEQALGFTNNVVAHTSAGSALHLYDQRALDGARLAYNDWWDNAGGDLGGYVPTLDATNLTVAPGFVSYVLDADPDADSLLLAAGSPLIDAGSPEILDPDGSPSDIGAWGGPEAPTGDADGDGADARQDCDEDDATVHPGAAETWYDGVDQDCDGNDADQDGDGVTSPEDCDDRDAALAADCGAGADSADVPGETGEKPGAEPGGCGCDRGGTGAGLGVLGIMVARGRRRGRARTVRAGPATLLVSDSDPSGPMGPP